MFESWLSYLSLYPSRTLENIVGFRTPCIVVCQPLWSGNNIKNSMKLKFSCASQFFSIFEISSVLWVLLQSDYSKCHLNTLMKNLRIWYMYMVFVMEIAAKMETRFRNRRTLHYKTFFRTFRVLRKNVGFQN